MPNFIQRMVRFYLYFQFLFFGTCLINPLFAKDLDRWTLGVGVAVISDNDTTGAVYGQLTLQRYLAKIKLEIFA